MATKQSTVVEDEMAEKTQRKKINLSTLIGENTL
jgi:hypothetical protein